MSSTDDLRAAAIEDLRVVGVEPSPELQAVVDLTARVCNVPYAVVNLFTEHRLHQIAGHGLDPVACRREDAMCWEVIDEPGTVAVPDARVDPRFDDNPFVNGHFAHARFYASHPLVTSEDVLIGRLCVFDDKPDQTRAQVEAALDSLGVVAARVMEVLELRLRSRQLAESLDHVETMSRELRASHDRLAAFAGQISHDLKSPLSSVTMSLGMISQELAGGSGPELDEVAWLATKAVSGAERMRALIDDVLAYAMVGGTGQHADVDLATVVGEAREDLALELDGVPLEVSAMPVVTGDHTQLRSLVQNLLSNAASQRHPDRALVISVSASRHDGRWVLEVSDTGRGIRAEDAERVFEPLVRTEESPFGGHGIGLATCRRIVEAHAGRIGLRPRREGGTVAWVELPADPGAPEA